MNGPRFDLVSPLKGPFGELTFDMVRAVPHDSLVSLSITSNFPCTFTQLRSFFQRTRCLKSLHLSNMENDTASLLDALTPERDTIRQQYAASSHPAVTSERSTIPIPAPNLEVISFSNIRFVSYDSNRILMRMVKARKHIGIESLLYFDSCSMEDDVVTRLKRILPGKVRWGPIPGTVVPGTGANFYYISGLYEHLW